MSNSRKSWISKVTLLVMLLSTSIPAKSEAFNFWYGSRGNTGKVIASLCQMFNERNLNSEVICTNLGSYEATLQKTIAAYRAGKQPALVQIFGRLLRYLCH